MDKLRFSLYVAQTLENTFLSFNLTTLVKGKNALGRLVTSSNTKPCNLNTSVSRDNNTGSCMEEEGRSLPLKDCTQDGSHFPTDIVICFCANGRTEQQSLVLLPSVLNCIQDSVRPEGNLASSFKCFVSVRNIRIRVVFIWDVIEQNKYFLHSSFNSSTENYIPLSCSQRVFF